MSDPWAWLLGDTADNVGQYDQPTGTGVAPVYPQYTPAPPPPQNDYYVPPDQQGNNYDWFTQTYQPNLQPSQPSAYDLMSSGGGNQPTQQQDAYSQMQQPNQPQNQGLDLNPFDIIGNTWNAIAAPWQQPATATNPFEWLGDNANRVAESVAGGMGEAFKPLGNVVDNLADSDIPVANVAAGAGRNIWEQAVEPAANLFMGTIGEAAHGANQFVGDVFNDVTSGKAGNIPGDLVNDWQQSVARQPLIQGAYAAMNPWARDQQAAYRQQQMEQAYQQAIASGMSEDDANKLATRTGIKLVNPVTAAEAPAMQDFSQLPIAEQLVLQFMKENPANMIYDRALAPVMKPLHAGAGLTGSAIGAGANALADVTGTRPFFDNLGAAIEGPQKFLSRTDNDLKSTQDLLTVAEQALHDPQLAEQAVFLDPSSDFYWADHGIREDIATSAARRLGLIAKNAQEIAKTNDQAQTPQETILPANETEMARRVQDTSPGAENTLFDEQQPPKTNNFTPADQTPTRPATLDEQINYALSDYKEMRARELQKADPGAALHDLYDQAKAEAETFRPGLKTPDDVANFKLEQGIRTEEPFDTGTPQPNMDDFFTKRIAPPEPGEITDLDRAIGIPDVAHTHGELLEAVKRDLGLARKSYVPEGTKGNLRLRETKPLEQFGPAGKALNTFAKFTMPYMGRAFLNKQGRAIRDTASNLLKYAAEGFGHGSDTNPRFERIHAMAGIERPAETLAMGKSSSLADIGGKESRGGFAKELFYHVMNPFDELSSDLMRAVSRKLGKGEIKDWNDFTEKAEGKLKTYAYKREFLRLWDQAIEDRVRSGSLDPAIADHLHDGTLTEKQIENFMAQRFPRGADLDQMAKGAYNPQHFADAVMDRYKKIFGDQAGEIGKIVKTGLDNLQERVNQYNKENKQRYDAALSKLSPNKKGYEAEKATLRATYRQDHPLRIQDVDPNHPLWREMKQDIFKQLDVANKAAQIQESLDPEIRRAVRDQIVQSMDWVERQRTMNSLKRFLGDRVDTREKSGYYDKYNRDEPTKAEPAAPVAAPAARPFNANVEKLVKEVKAYKDTEGHSFAGQKILNFLNKPEPGKIVTRYEMADGAHYRITTPDQLGKNGQAERQVWPPKPAEAAPAAASTGKPANSRDRILKEIRATGYNEAHAKMGMALLDEMAKAYEQRTGRSRNDVYDKIIFRTGDKANPGALHQTAELRKFIDMERKSRGIGPDQRAEYEIPGAREAEDEDEFRRILRRWEDRQHGPAITDRDKIDRFVKDAVKELKYQMSLEPEKSGLTWYTDTWENAMKTMREAFPELKSDQDAERLFKLFTGLTSQGTGVLPNIKKAMMAFNRFADSGRIRVTKGDAEKFERRALGLTDKNLNAGKALLKKQLPDYTKFSLGSERLKGLSGKKRTKMKETLEKEGVAWLTNRQQALGIKMESIKPLHDLLASEAFRDKTPAAFDWLKEDHTKEEILRIYDEMVNVDYVTETFRRVLDAEYKDGEMVPGTRVLGPTPPMFGMETGNFLKLVDLNKKAFNGDIKTTLDWLTDKHSEAEFKAVADILFKDQATKDSLLAEVREAIANDKDIHTQLGDRSAHYEGAEYGSRIFGPKIGNFVANLFGGSDRTTKDLWFTTTWNRLMGILEKDDTEFITQPTPAQRPIMDQAMIELMQELKRQDIDITMSTAQALLWFYEKQLAEIHGRVSSSEDYASVKERAVQELAGNKVDTRKGKAGFRPDPKAEKVIEPGRPTPSTYRRVSTGDSDIGPHTGLDRAAYEAEMNRPMLPQEAGKKTLGTTEFADNGQYIISIFKDANASTMPHELAHVFRQFLDGDLLKATEDWAEVKDGKWTVPAEEKFARGFEAYLREGKAPTPTLKAVFDQFRLWLQNIYRKIKGSEIDVKLTPEIRAVFSKMLGGDPDKIVARETKAPEPEAATAPVTPEERAAAAGPVGTPVEPTSQFDKTFNAGTASTSDKTNPNVAYQDRLPVERALRKAAFDNGKGPREIDKVRGTDLKSRTDGKAYMNSLFEAARKDGLSEDQIAQAAGQPAPATANVTAEVKTTKVPNAPKAQPVSLAPFGKTPEVRPGANGQGNEAAFPVTTRSGKATPFEVFMKWNGRPDVDAWNDTKRTYQIRNTQTGEVLPGKWRMGGDLVAAVKDAMRKQEGPKVLRQEADEHTQEELASYNRAINAPSGIRMDTEDGKQGQVLAPNTLRKIVGDWNRGKHYGDLVSDQLSQTQKKNYIRDILATDEYIRSTTGNTFKLDLDNFTPVRISDGKSLDELLGRARQSNIGEAKPTWPAGDPPNSVGAVLIEVQNYFGKDARKGFAELKKEQGQAAVDMAYAELAKRLGFPDPTNPATPTQMTGAQTGYARQALAVLEADARERYRAAANKQSEMEALNEAKEQTKESLSQKAFADMAKMMLDADRGAYKRTEGVYFDYRNKNVIDQVVGSILPFNYWGRRNFAYVARYFAQNPVQFAAVLQFYKNMEQQNQDAGGIAPYNMGNMLLWKNPDGSKVQWNMSSMMPFNPLGNSDSLMQLIDASDAENGDTVNKTPLAFLFGADRVYNGKVTGRDKGIIPSFLSPNPVIDILLKTGVPNDFAKKLGIVTDGFGSPDPSDKRATTQTTGLVAGRTAIRDIADRTGLTKLIRDQATKMGIKFTDLDLEGPINELIFGMNAGKPLTAVMQELTEMAQGDGKNKEQYLLALAKLKQGNWTPEALKALDTVESQGAWQRAASMAGFVSVVNNTPRQQLSNNLSAGYGKVAGDNGHYEVTSTDPKTGYQTKKFVPGESSKFFDENPGASVSFAKNKNPDQIIEGVGNDRTSKAYADLNKAYFDDKKISLKQYNKGLDDLKAGNPTFFKVAKDKNYQQAKGELPYLPGETHKTVADIDQQYAKQEIPAERSYAEFKDALYNAGGKPGRYQELSDQMSAAYDKKDWATYDAIKNSKEYNDLKSARTAIQNQYPTEAARYKAENDAKYGTTTTSSSTKTSTTSTKSSSKSTYVPYKKTTTTYKSSGSSGGGTTWTKAQSSLYGRLIGEGYSKTAAASVVNKAGPTAGASTAPKTTAAPRTTTGVTSQPTGSSNSTWDNVQRKAYALALADGYSKTYASTVADRIGSGQSTGYKSKLTGVVASYGAGGKPAGSPTTVSKPLTTQSTSLPLNGGTTPLTASGEGYWQRNANGDIEATNQAMRDAGWQAAASGWTSYAAAKKAADKQTASTPTYVHAVVYDPDTGSYAVYSKGYMSLDPADNELLRSETIAKANSAGYTSSGGGRSGGGGRSRSRSTYIHPLPAPYRVPLPSSGSLNRLNKGRKF